MIFACNLCKTKVNLNKQKVQQYNTLASRNKDTSNPLCVEWASFVAKIAPQDSFWHILL